MTKIILDKWDGGVQQSDRPDNGKYSSKIQNYDIFVDKKKMFKSYNVVLQTGSGASVITGECPVHDAVIDIDGQNLIGCGRTSSVNSLFRFYRQNDFNGNVWTQNSSVGISVDERCYSLQYKDLIYGCTAGFSNDTRLYRYDTDSSMTLIGSFGSTRSIVKPIIHSQDNIMYLANGRNIATFNGSTFTALSTVVLPFPCISMCEYGSYVVFLCQSPFGSVALFWGRDTSLSTFQNSIQVGDGTGFIVCVIDGILTVISQEKSRYFNYNIGTIADISIKMYLGGTFKKIINAKTEFTESGTNERFIATSFIKNNIVYFTLGSNTLWKFGLNESGEYTLSRERKVCEDSQNVLVMFNIFNYGDFSFASYKDATNNMALSKINSDGSLTLGNLAFYETYANPNMPLFDKLADKMFTKITAKISKTSQAFRILYKIDAESIWTELISDTRSGLVIVEATAESNELSLKNFRDIFFRFETTGDSQVLEFSYEYENLNSLY